MKAAKKPFGKAAERSVAEYSVPVDKVGLRTIKDTPLGDGYVGFSSLLFHEYFRIRL